MSPQREHATISYQGMMVVMAWVLFFAMFMMVVWLVQQSKIQALRLSQMELQQQRFFESMKSTKSPLALAESSTQELVAVSNVSPETPTAASNLPKDAVALLEEALTELRTMRVASKAAKYKEAGQLIAGIKAKIWKASDMVPKVQQENLRKLMGILDYTAKQLKDGKDGDSRTPIETVNRILEGKDG